MANSESGGSSGQVRRDRAAEETDEQAPPGEDTAQERHAKLSEDVDDILDEIDEVLEQNAEEFVRAYVQKGGQ
jgi:ubiquitin-like protein Pup